MRAVRRREAQPLLPARYSQPASATSLCRSAAVSEALTGPKVLFGDVQEGMGGAPLHVPRAGGNTPPGTQGFGHGEGSC